MKKLLASSLIALTAPALLVTPAGAAVPKKEAKRTIACPDGHGTARLWFTVGRGRLIKLAVDNPCDRAVEFASVGNVENGAADEQWFAAAGAHFNWSKKRIGEYGAGHVTSPNLGGFMDEVECGGATTRWVIYRYNNVREACDE